MVICWLATAPTPQFVDVLDRIAAERPDLEVVAWYSDLSDRGRGWGSLVPSHPHQTPPSPRLRAFLSGLLLGSSPSTRKLVVLGYADPFRSGALLGARWTGKPVFTLSDSSMNLESRRSPRRRALKRVMLRTLFGKRAVAWTISEDNARFWEFYGVRLGVRVPFESPVPVPEHAARDSARLRETVLAGDEGLLVLCVARDVPEKEVPVVAAAVQELRRRGVAVRLLVVGASATGWASLRGPGVTCRDPMKHGELAAAYLAADAFALCSSSEPYGLVVREALQFGLPVVASSEVPSAAWLCDYGWNIVPVGNVDATADALEHALTGGRWTPRPPEETAKYYIAGLSGSLE